MKTWRIGIALAVLAIAGTAVVFLAPRLKNVQAAGSVPTAAARQGDFLVLVRCRGEVKARRSVQIVAPANVPELRIVWLAPPSSLVKPGDVVIKFDPSSAKLQLDEKEAALRQAEASLVQAIAQANITAEQNKIDLAEASYQVERAKLETAKAEIVSKLQGDESRIDLGLAEQKLSAKKAQADLSRASDEAKVASLTRLRDKAKDDVAVTRSRLEQMELRASIAGLIQFLNNNSQGWINAKPFKVGDQVWSGAPLAEIPDLESLDMEGKVEEIDRGRLALSQQARIRIDSLPESTFEAQLTTLSPMTVASFEWPPVRTFRASAHMAHPDARVRPSMNGQMDVVVERMSNCISIPAKALFAHQGKPIVYIARRNGYESKAVKVLARNPDEVAVEGIPGGTQVALVEPDKAGPERKL
jgi:HlyD family secretion protein